MRKFARSLLKYKNRCCPQIWVSTIMSDFKPVPVFESHGLFLRSVIEMLFKNVIFNIDKNKVVLWKDPKKLKDILDLKLSNAGNSHESLLKSIESVLKYSVKTGHPYFMNQLFSGLDPYGLAGQWITDALNISVYTYEVAPVFTLMEQTVLREFCDIVGYPDGDGFFCPGGSMANGTAMNIARYSYFPEIKKHGISKIPKLVVFTSEEAHYSVHKMASLLGIGESNVIQVQTDDVGCIIVSDFEDKVIKQISLGNVPLVVVATLGTTVRGAFDPIIEMSEVCKKYKIWLHADAAWGGGAIFSKTHRNKLNGIELTDSVVINPHKLLAVPQQCSVLLVKDGRLLNTCHTKEAQYLFQKDKFYDTSYDCGDKYFQCGRKCDVFKFWLMWRAKGTAGFENHVDMIMDTSKYLTDAIQSRDDFKLVSTPQFINVCFWYIPPSLKDGPAGDDYNNKLQKVAPQLKEILVREGLMMINYQPLKDYPNFFRFVSQNSSLTKKDIDYILNTMANKGKEL